MTTSSKTDCAEGEARKATALHLLEATRSGFIRQARRQFLAILFERPEATVDDLHDVLNVPAGMNPTVLGAAINGLAMGKMIEGTGYRKTSRPVAHARPNRVWKLSAPVKARQWLAANPDALNTHESPPLGGGKKVAQRQLPLALGVAPNHYED